MSQTGPTPGSQSSLREANRTRVLDVLKRHGGLTQVELASATGLSAATVSIIVKELEAADMVTAAPTTRSGRRAQRVSLTRQLGLVAGVHFSHRTLRLALSDLAGEVVAAQHMPLPPDHRADTGLDRAAMLIHDMLDDLGAKFNELRAVGMGVPAPIDPISGHVASTGLMRGWEDVAIAESAGERMALPVYVSNSTNLAALAEYRYGPSQGADVVVYLSIGPRVGSGIMIHGDIFAGQAGGAGEIAHIRVQEGGLICRCGNRGCLDTIVNSAALTDSLRPSYGVLSLQDVIEKARAGDAGCERVVADAGQYVGAALGALCNVINPKFVIVGGELARCGELLLEPLRVVARRATLPNTFAPFDVIPGALGDQAAVRGALTLALSSVSISLIQEAPRAERTAA